MPSQQTVSFYTRQGKPRTRYSLQERLKICGATEHDLDSFIKVFCPDRPLFAQTRRGTKNPRDWITPKGRLSKELVLKHLVGDAIPGIGPTWIAPRSWEVSSWCGIDVDYRGDRDDFIGRCKRVRRLLQLAGISRNMILVSKTPSGGRHYRFFLDRKVRVFEIANIMNRLGLWENPGRTEIFPKTSKGMRLPFGLMPGQKHDPNKWVKFIRAFRRGFFPTVNWSTFELATRGFQIPEELEDPTYTAKATPTSATQPTTHDLPQIYLPSACPKQRVRQCRYIALYSRPFKSREDAVELEQLGICLEGTRTRATNRLAWHFIFSLKLNKEEAIRRLTEWVYRTGTETSSDVKRDLRNGTRHVAKQIADCVHWMCSRKASSSSPSLVQNGISDSEIAQIRTQLGPQLNCQLRFLRVALRVLAFAKRYGKRVANGWEAALAINGIVRTWPECRGRDNYKQYMDGLIRCGFLTLVKEKIQTANKSGRARVYRVNISEASTLEKGFTLESAITALTCYVQTEFRKHVMQQETQDTYLVIYHTPSKKDNEVTLEVAQADARQEFANQDAAAISSQHCATSTSVPYASEWIRTEISPQTMRGNRLSDRTQRPPCTSLGSDKRELMRVFREMALNVTNRGKNEDVCERSYERSSTPTLDQSRSSGIGLLSTPRTSGSVQHEVNPLPGTPTQRGASPPNRCARETRSESVCRPEGFLKKIE